MSPAAGKVAGGTLVTVTGAAFSHVSKVLFGTAAGTKVHVVSAGKLTVTAPKHAAGTVDVRVVSSSGKSAASAADHFAFVPPPGAVTAGGVVKATTTTLTLQWKNPPAAGLAGVVVRRAKASAVPGFTTGMLVASLGKTVTSFTDKKLSPGTRYTYALFARGLDGTHGRADSLTGATSAPLKIAAAALPQGTAGMTYLAHLDATGGTAPYMWKAAGLPTGLALASSGAITGYPSATGTDKVTVTVTDAEHTSRIAELTLKVPAALPAGCAAKSCAQLTPDGKTIQVPAADISGVTPAAGGGTVTAVTLTQITVAAGNVLVLAPAAGIPSGLIAIAGTVTDNGDGSDTVAVTPGTPADAYDAGTVQALPGGGANATPANAAASRQPDTAGPRAVPGVPASPAAPAAELACSGGVSSDLLGLSVTHTLTPSLVALWKHPYFGSGGVYVGSGGLQLFQFDLDGTITLNLGISVSGKATCTLTLPTARAAVPAGDLGAVIFAATPKLTFTTTGEIDERGTVSLDCGAEYRWDQGSESRVAYCTPSETPLALTADTGLDATLKADLDAEVTLDDLVGITGDIWAQAHAGYHPAAHPVAELDASAGYGLKACLACFWSGSPATVTIGSGTFFSKTLATYGTPPAITPPVIITTTLPAGTVGKPYSAQLTTADHRAGTWKITAGKLPPGLSLSGYSLSGKPTAAGTDSFKVMFTDTHGKTAAATVTVKVSEPVTWTAAEALLPSGWPAGARPAPAGVSCPSVSFCAAIGTNEGPGNAIWFRKNGAWTAAQQVPLPSDAAAPPGGSASWVRLTAVSCPSSSLCVVVGAYYSNSSGINMLPLVMTWEDGSWQQGTLLYSAEGDTDLSGVSCPTTSYCVAVGTDVDNGPGTVTGIEATWTGGSVWTVGDAQEPANGIQDQSILTAVSCASVSFCAAAGTFEDTSDGVDGLLLTLSGGVWTPAVAPLPAAAGVTPDMYGMSCPSASSCVVAGVGSTAFVLTLAGGQWTRSSEPDLLYGVSCSSPSSCVAVGSYNSNLATHGLLLTLSGGKWTLSQAPSPANTAGYANLTAVSCVPASGCAAVGFYVDTSNEAYTGMLLNSSG